MNIPIEQTDFSVSPIIDEGKKCRIPQSCKSNLCHYRYSARNGENKNLRISGCDHPKRKDSPKGVCPDEAVPVGSEQDDKPVMTVVYQSSLVIDTDPQSDV